MTFSGSDNPSNVDPFNSEGCTPDHSHASAPQRPTTDRASLGLAGYDLLENLAPVPGLPGVSYARANEASIGQPSTDESASQAVLVAVFPHHRQEGAGGTTAIEAARNLYQAAHPNLVRVRTWLPLNDDIVVISDLIPSLTVQQLIDSRGGLPLPQLQTLMVGLGRGLRIIHHHHLSAGILTPTTAVLGPQQRPMLSQAGWTSLAGLAPEDDAALRHAQAQDVYQLALIGLLAATTVTPQPQAGPTHPAHPQQLMREHPAVRALPEGMVALWRQALDLSPQAQPSAEQLAVQMAHLGKPEPIELVAVGQGGCTAAPAPNAMPTPMPPPSLARGKHAAAPGGTVSPALPWSAAGALGAAAADPTAVVASPRSGAPVSLPAADPDLEASQPSSAVSPTSAPATPDPATQWPEQIPTEVAALLQKPREPHQAGTAPLSSLQPALAHHEDHGGAPSETTPSAGQDAKQKATPAVMPQAHVAPAVGVATSPSLPGLVAAHTPAITTAPLNDPYRPNPYRSLDNPPTLSARSRAQTRPAAPTKSRAGGAPTGKKSAGRKSSRVGGIVVASVLVLMLLLGGGSSWWWMSHRETTQASTNQPVASQTVANSPTASATASPTASTPSPAAASPSAEGADPSTSTPPQPQGSAYWIKVLDTLSQRRDTMFATGDQSLLAEIYVKDSWAYRGDAETLASLTFYKRRVRGAKETLQAVKVVGPRSDPENAPLVVLEVTDSTPEMVVTDLDGTPVATAPGRGVFTWRTTLVDTGEQAWRIKDAVRWDPAKNVKWSESHPGYRPPMAKLPTEKPGQSQPAPPASSSPASSGQPGD